MCIDSLGIPIKDDITPLHLAAKAGNTRAAKKLVARRPNLVYERTTTGLLPFHFAAESGHRKTLAFLISNTHDDVCPNPYAAQSGIKLLNYAIDAGFYDVALHLARTYPDLAKLRNDDDACSALQKIAGKVDVLLRQRREMDILVHLIIYSIPGAKAIYGPNKDMIREEALELAKCLCDNMQDLDDTSAKTLYVDAMIEALHCGTSEVIQIILEAFPKAMITTMRMREPFIFGLLVENRCEIFFDLIFQTSSLCRGQYLENLDFEKNNILHRTAKLAPVHKLNLACGAALQMQRELQWYKEVEKLVTPHARDQKNKDGKTPRMLFTEQHKNLKSKGAMWIKCVAAILSLYAVAFIFNVVSLAAAVTLLVRKKQGLGLPLFGIIAVAFSGVVSLFASVTSLLLLVSILIWRFEEEDFVYALPRRLINAILSLFVSMMFSIVTFGATLYVMFVDVQDEGFMMPGVVVGCLYAAAATFSMLLFTIILVDVISNTYGSGNLGNQINGGLTLASF